MDLQVATWVLISKVFLPKILLTTQSKNQGLRPS